MDGRSSRPCGRRRFRRREQPPVGSPAQRELAAMSSRVRMSRTLFFLSILAFWTSTCDLVGQRIFSSDGGQPAPAKIADVRNKDRKSTRLNSSHTVISYAV